MSSQLVKSFGNELRRLREAKGLSQEALALDCNLDRTFISMLERGKRQPTLSTLFTLAKVLGARPSDILSRIERSRK